MSDDYAGGDGRIDAVLSRLQGVKRSGADEFRAFCPVHEIDGGGKSVRDLAISEGRRGVVIYCFAGCDVRDVRKAIDLPWSAFFYEGEEAENAPVPIDPRGRALEALTAAARLPDEPIVLEKARLERGWSRFALQRLGVGWDGERFTLPVTDEKGRAHDVLRYDPYASRLKMLAGKGKSRKPWPAPELVETKHRTRGLCLVEGEGTAISVNGVGLPVVALPGAIPRASGDVHRPGHFEGVGWHRAWARRFTKFGRIWLFPDADDVGRTLMRTVEYDLAREGCRPIVVDLGGPKGFDLGDLLRPAITTAHRLQARELILMLAECATRHIPQLPDARATAFAWSEWLTAPQPELVAAPVADPSLPAWV